MRESLLSAAACALLVAAPSSQEPARPSASTASNWSAFVAEHGAEWQAAWAPGTGTPLDIWGPGLRLQNGPIDNVVDARRHARSVIERFAALLGRGETTFVEDIQAKSRQVWTFGYAQYYKGLPCVTGRLNIMINDVGVLALFGSTALPVPRGMAITPKIPVGQARAIAYLHEHLDPGAEPLQVGVQVGARLVVWGDAYAPRLQAPRLAWEIKIEDLDAGKIGRAYVDAGNGAFLQYANDLHQCGFGGECSHSLEGRRKLVEHVEPRMSVSHGEAVPGMVNVTGTVLGWVNDGLCPDPAATRVLLPMRNIQVSVVGGGQAFTDNSGAFDIPHAGTASVQVTVTLRGRFVGRVVPAQGTAVVVTTPATPGTPVNITMLSPTPAQFDAAQLNAYWAADNVNQFVTARGGTVGASLDGVTCNVNQASSCNATYSNFTTNFYHAAGGCANTAYPSVIYHEWGHGLDHANGGLNQNEGLSEGGSDFISMAVLDSPILGKDFFGPGTEVRTGLNTRTFPAGGGVHQQGETWMGWGWDVHVNLQATLGNAAALTLYRDYAVGFFAANPGTQAAAVRAVFVIDDDDGDLTNGTPNCNSLQKACLKRNLPNPAKCLGTPVYTVYGDGCKGSGPLPLVCMSLNQAGGTLTGGRSPVEFAFQAMSPSTSALTVTGFNYYTQGFNRSTTTVAHVYAIAEGGRPQAAAARTGMMTIEATPGFYTTMLNTPLVVAAGKSVFVSVGTTDATVSNLGAGVIGTTFQRAQFGRGAWASATSTYRPSFEVICQGIGPPGAIPVLTNTGEPTIGQSFNIDLEEAAQSSAAVLLFGSSDSQWGALSLPLSLTQYGAAGCNLLCSAEVEFPVVTNGMGQGSYSAPIPNIPALVDLWFYNQFVVVDPTANNLGFAFSNGGKGRVGRP